MGEPLPKPKSNPLARESVLSLCRPLIEAGAALHWLRPRSKAPAEAKWSEAPRYSEDDLHRLHREGANVGLRLGEPSLTPAGYLHAIDLDIRDPDKADEARATLRRLMPKWQEFPSAVSGSGGDSRHFLFFCSRAFRSRKLVQSPGAKMVFDQRLGREVRKHDWEIELFGTGKQIAIAPSIHPDTGRAYRWERRIDFDLLDLGVGPTVSPERVEAWGAAPAEPEDDDDGDDLLTIVRAAPLDLTEDEIDGVLADLPPEWVEDRECWVNVGMALHHEMEGTREAFEKWCEWSRQSAKFELKDSRAVWKSFKGRKRPVRMATLIKAANAYRVEEGSAESGNLAAQLEWFDAIKPDLSRRYLVKGLLDIGALSCLYGASNAGKTFVGLDLAYHIATGQTWAADASGSGGHRVRKAAVLYLALEGGRGILNRIAALRQHKGAEGERIPFALRRAGANLRKPGGDVKRIIELHRELMEAAGDPEMPSMIVVDTLSRALPGGEENGSADMTAFVANVDHIRDATGAHVLIVHHTGKDQAKGMRGHSSLVAAIDHEIHVEHDPAAGGLRFITGGKQRDQDRHGRIPFRLIPITLGTDPDGDPVTSCAVDLKPDLMEDARVAALSAAGKAAWNEMRRLMRTEDGEDSIIDSTPSSEVSKSALIDALAARSRAVEEKARNEYGHKGLRALMKAGLVTISADVVALNARDPMG